MRLNVHVFLVSGLYVGMCVKQCILYSYGYSSVPPFFLSLLQLQRLLARRGRDLSLVPCLHLALKPAHLLGLPGKIIIDV